MNMNESTEQVNIHKKSSRRKYIITTGIVLLFIILVLVFSLYQTEPKTDPGSEKIIREAVAIQLNKNPNELTDEDFTSIISLTIGENARSSHSYVTELSDIKILEKFTNLQTLSLGRIIYPRKQIPKWMVVLAKLGIYDIDKKFALDLSPLEKLQSLKRLVLRRTVIKNINNLSGLVNLQHLDLIEITVSDQQIADLQESLPNLKIGKTHSFLILNEKEVSF